MFRKHLVSILVILLIIPLMGCGIKNAFFKKKVPPLEEYATVVFAPFDLVKPSVQYAELPTMISYGIGTKLGVRYEDKTWIFDQSQEVTPVSDKLKELNISARDTYEDIQAALKLANAFQADLVVVGEMEDPKFTKEESGKIEEDKSKVSVTGAARYYSIHQDALLPINTMIIDVKSGNVIWDGRIVGFKRYKTRYRTGNPPKSEREETMLADVRRELVTQVANTMYPPVEK
jgi:hypothetical protein